MSISVAESISKMDEFQRRKELNAVKVSERELDCLKLLVGDEEDSEYYDPGEACYYFRYLEKELNLDRSAVRRAVRSLARKGLAEYRRGLFDEDGMVAGSGYSATKLGVDYVVSLREKS